MDAVYPFRSFMLGASAETSTYTGLYYTWAQRLVDNATLTASTSSLVIGSGHSAAGHPPKESVPLTVLR